jgi:HTH-type transcriptional regulator/antitoxin HigA
MRLKANADAYALLGWSLQVLALARENPIDAVFDAGYLSSEFFRALVSLSMLDDGPKHVPPFLAKAGIALVVLPHFKRTYLDGAVYLAGGEHPVIGLSLRYDRLDNFWFVLFHELGHLALGHLTGERTWIADDLDLQQQATSEEAAADRFAATSLLPPDFDLHGKGDLTAQDILRYAREKAIHPAIVAGRIQHERIDFRTFSRLVGRGEVRKNFIVPGKGWAK